MYLISVRELFSQGNRSSSLDHQALQEHGEKRSREESKERVSSVCCRSSITERVGLYIKRESKFATVFIVSFRCLSLICLYRFHAVL